MTTTSATSTATPTPSLVTALGSGSGIDMAALATNLATAQFASQVGRLTTKSETLTAQISSAANLKSMMLNIATSLGNAVRTGGLSPQPQIAAANVASGSLSGTRTPSGSYSLEVTTLAKSQTLASAAFSNSEASQPVGGGTLTLRFGDISQPVSDPDTRTAVDITIAPDAKLSDVANAINATNTGVTAYVAQTAQGAQLVFKGKEGVANGFTLETSETPANSGLARLAWKPSSTTGQLVTTAGDASFKVDGLPRTSPSNSVSEAIPGVTLKLAGTNVGAPTTVTFSDASAALTSTMTDLTGALNEIAAALNTATDLSTGDLRSDSGARALKRSFSQLAGTVVMPNATGAARTLADLGLSTQRDGTFVLDSNRLKATMAKDPEGVAAMFTNGLYGAYATVDKLSRSATDASNPGSLGGSISRFNKQLAQTKVDQTTITGKQDALRASLTKRFAVSDTRISASKATLSFLQGQIDAWNKSDS